MKKSFLIFIVFSLVFQLLFLACGGSSGGSDTPDANQPAKWYVAKGAPTDAQGADGDLYLDTDATVVYVKAGGHWVAAASLKGPAGSGWLFGAGAPAASLGVNGDFYLDTSTTMTYRKFNGAWESMFAMQGAAGAAGIDGAAWYTGTTDPTPSVPAAAKAGDFYLNTQTTVIWKKAAGGSWSSLVMLQAAGPAQFVFTPEMYYSDFQ